MIIIKGEKRRRPGKWLLDYRDSGGVRHVLTFRTKDEAALAGARLKAEAAQPRHPACDVNVTVAEYAERWLGQVKARDAKPRTLESYRSNLDLHILPRFGAERLRLVHRAQVKGWLVERLAAGASRGTVRLLLATFRALLSAAVQDDLIPSNPAGGVGRQLNLAKAKEAEPEKVKAFDREQVRGFMLAAPAAPRYAVFFFTLARTGIRLGEGVGLRWSDIDFQARRIAVSRTVSRGREGTPKSGHGRSVDMSGELAAALTRHLTEAKREGLAAGRGWSPEQPVFTTLAGTTLDASKTGKAMSRVLKAAGLPGHHSPHSFRHTFASLLLQRGEPVQYVSEQLGHASVELTTKVYGKWLRKEPLVGGVNGLDDASGNKTVTEAAVGGGVLAEVREVVDALAAGLPTSSYPARSGSPALPALRCRPPSP